MPYCLPKPAVDNFKQKLKDGTIKPEELMKMTSKERRAFFEDIVGKENAQEVNAGFESKIILKDQQRGMINWAKEIAGIKPEVQRDILTKVNKLESVLQPEELDMFLEDLAAKRLGVGVSVKEAGEIVRLAGDIAVKKEKMLPDNTFPTEEDKLAYGYAQVDFIDYVNDLKQKAESYSLKEIFTSVDTAKEFALDKVKNPGEAIVDLGGTTKSVKASLDDSALLNQGLPVLWAHPTIWQKNAFDSFKNIYNTFGGKNVMREIRAEILSDPEAIDGTYKKMKLAVGVTEEAFPSQVPEQIPYLGRAFKAAETAFTAFQYRNRRDVARLYLRINKEMGNDITDKTKLEAWGKLVNSLTGRGYMGKAEAAANILNNTFFSPRFLKSHFDNLILHPIFGAGGDSFVRKQSAKNLLKMVIGTAMILAVWRAVGGKDSIELDFRSTNAGKIKVFGQWTDITGGMASILTLAARIGTWSSKSATTGKVTAINSGKFGATTGWDLATNFFGNKLSPLAGILRDYLKGQDPNGNKATIPNEAVNLFAPIPVTTFTDLNRDPNKANVLGAMILNTLGANVNAYSPSSAGTVAQDKPAVVEEILQKYAAGDAEGGKALAHDFNDQLKGIIHDEILKNTPDIDPNILDTQVNKKWKADAIYLPTDAQVQKFKTGDENIVASIAANGKPVIKTGTTITSDGLIGFVMTYAKAIGTDPATAFNDIFKGQVIQKVTNGTVIVKRMSLNASQAVKKAGGGDNASMKLDHTLPLELGGNNERNNLKLVSTAAWQSYSPVENYLGKRLRAGTVSKKDAQKAILDFKAGLITFADIQKEFK